MGHHPHADAGRRIRPHRGVPGCAMARRGAARGPASGADRPAGGGPAPTACRPRRHRDAGRADRQVPPGAGRARRLPRRAVGGMPATGHLPAAGRRGATDGDLPSGSGAAAAWPRRPPAERRYFTQSWWRGPATPGLGGTRARSKNARRRCRRPVRPAPICTTDARGFVEDLRRGEAAPQVREDHRYHRIVDLGEPPVDGDDLGNRAVFVLLQVGTKGGDIAQQPAGLILAQVQPGPQEQLEAVVARFRHPGAERTRNARQSSLRRSRPGQAHVGNLSGRVPGRSARRTGAACAC